MNDENRLRYYFADKYEKKFEIELSSIAETFRCEGQTVMYCGDKNPCKFSGWWGDDNSGYFNINNSLNVGFFDIGFFLMLYASKRIDKKYYDLPILSMARNIREEKNLILLKYNYHSHWKNLDNKKFDIDWSQKISEPVFRGQPSGVQLNKLPSRGALVNKYFDKYNIAYSPPVESRIPANTKSLRFQDQKYIEHIKPYLTKEQLLKYKYLICFEGNDVSSGINWMLNSNSLILMPEPTQESWLMQGLLKPWVHYVPLNNEIDLDEKIEWCKSNDNECQNIVKNANEHIKMFLDEEKEKAFFKKVLNYYTEHVKFI